MPTNQPRRYKALVLSASAGAGHIRAADALAQECARRPEIASVENIDALVFTNALFRRFYSDLYIKMIRHSPTILGWWYESSDEPWKTDRMRIMLSRLNLRPLIRMLRELDPEITICTHFLPAEIISYLIQKKLIQTKLSIVVTDFDVHAMWLSRAFHHYFVAIEEAKVHLTMMGFPETRITVSGIPIDPVFGQKHDTWMLRGKHGVDPKKPIVLVSAGAMGVGSAEHVVRVLGYMKTPAQIVVICGHNEKLQAEVKERVAAIGVKAPHLSFRVLGFTNEMHEWMALADLYIGKPGGLTTSEAMASGLPMLIFQPIPGQEERNSDHLLEKGIAVKCNVITTMAYKVDMLLNDPAMLRRMSTAARQLGRPDAAKTVVSTLIAQMGYAPVKVAAGKRKKMQEFAQQS